MVSEREREIERSRNERLFNENVTCRIFQGQQVESMCESMYAFCVCIFTVRMMPTNQITYFTEWNCVKQKDRTVVKSMRLMLLLYIYVVVYCAF